MESERKRRPAGGGADLLAGDLCRNYPKPEQGAIRVLHLIARYHVRPEMALTLAGLAFGEPTGPGAG